MKLTEDESAALERRRQRMSDLGGFKGILITDRDSSILADAMLRLFPPGHDAEITQERWSRTGIDKPASGNDDAESSH